MRMIKDSCEQGSQFSLLFIAILFLFAGPVVQADTIFLANFDTGYDAVFSKGDGKAFFDGNIGEKEIKLVEGRFGKGVFVGRKVSARALNYAMKENFSSEEGTLEFWFRPEWDWDFKEPEGPEWLKGKTSVKLFSTGESPTGYRFVKNPYGALQFHYRVRYKEKALVYKPIHESERLGKFWQKGVWVHCAISWDRKEARLFLNGELISVSSEWETPVVGAASRMTLGSRPNGSPDSAWGTFDDFRISDNKKYISSFPLPEEPLKVEKTKLKSTGTLITEEEKKKLEGQKTTFLADFSDSLTAKFAAGSPNAITNRLLKIESVGNEKALCLKRYESSPGDTLCYLSEDNLNRFLGTAEITVSLADDNALPVILLDVTELVQKGSVRIDLRTGMRLIINEISCLEWQNLEENEITSSVVSGAIKLKKNEWYRFGFSWKGSTVSLLQKGRSVAHKEGIAIPSMLPRYIFVGSNSQGENTLDGWIKQVKIVLK